MENFARYASEKQGSTRLRMAQNSGQDNLLKKTRKWEGLAISLTGRCLAQFPASREHPRFQKGISAWKKVNAFFSRGASFLAKTSRSGVNLDPFRGWKAAQNPCACAIFAPYSCASDDRLAAKTSLPASISQFFFVKKSESFFFTFFHTHGPAFCQFLFKLSCWTNVKYGRRLANRA